MMSVVIATAVTPLIVYLWGRAFPIANNSEFGSVDYDTLKKRNGWIDVIATLTMFIGVLLPFLLVGLVRKDRVIWLPALAIGLMVISHFAWVCAVTLPSGAPRFREFWRFYELRWGIGISGIKLVYIPVGALGVVAAVMLWL